MTNILKNTSVPSGSDAQGLHRLRTVTAAIVSLWIIAQIAVVAIYWELPAYSDSAAYRRLALEAADCGWYPLASHLYSENYIFNPGYVNFLVLYVRIFGAFTGIGIVNICLTVCCYGRYMILWENLPHARHPVSP